MRWAYEGVTFEPSGVDHSSPGSSYVVGGPPRRGRLRRHAAHRADVRVRRHGGHGQDEQLEGRRADPVAGARHHGGAAAALALQPQAAVTVDHRLVRPGTAADVRRVGRADRAGWPPAPPSPPRSPRTAAPPATAARTAPRHPGAAAVRHPRLGVRRDDRPARSRCCGSCGTWRPTQRIESLDVLRPRLDRAAQWVTTELPAEQRTQVRAAPDLDAARRARRAAARVASSCCSTAWRRLVA